MSDFSLATMLSSPHIDGRMKRVRRTAPTDPFHRSETWIEAFATQCTEQLYEVGRRFAAKRAAVVRCCGGITDDYYIREMVANVVSDTAAGILRWNPEDESLEAHVLDAIWTRTNHDCARALRYRHESIDVFDPESPDTLIAEIEATLADNGPSFGFGHGAAPTERLARLRKLAGTDDTHVLGMLDAFEADAITKADVMHFTGMSAKEYHAARSRLTRLVAKLSLETSSSSRGSRKASSAHAVR
jgi:hypothetical protein